MLSQNIKERLHRQMGTGLKHDFSVARVVPQMVAEERRFLQAQTVSDVSILTDTQSSVLLEVL